MSLIKLLTRAAAAMVVIGTIAFVVQQRERERIERETLAAILADITHKGVDPMTTGANRQGAAPRR